MPLFRSVLIVFALLSSPSVAETTGRGDPSFAPGMSSAEFVRLATIGGLFEIEASKLALEHGDGKSKTLALTAFADFNKLSQELKTLAEKMNLGVPAELDIDHAERLEKLKRSKGGAFAREYDKARLGPSQTVVKLFEDYSAQGESRTLRLFASKYLPILRQHLKMASDLSR